MRKLINQIDPFQSVYQILSDVEAKRRNEQKGSRLSLDANGRIWQKLNKSERSLVATSAGKRCYLLADWLDIPTDSQRQLGRSIDRMRKLIVNSEIIEGS